MEIGLTSVHIGFSPPGTGYLLLLLRPEDYRQRRWAAIAEKYGGRYGIEGLRFIAGVVSIRYSISVNKRAE